MNKVVIIVGSAVGALLIALIIVGIVLVNTLNAQAENDRYQDCMARQGFAADQPVAGVNSDDELDRYIDAIAGAAERCAP